MAPGIQADGPGLSVSDAIAYVGGEPLLVNGVLLKQADGTVWLCEALLKSSPPQCAKSGLLVEHYVIGDESVLRAAGARWEEHAQLFGVVRH